MTTSMSETIFTCRCGVCRRRSKRSGVKAMRGLTPIIGRIHVYSDNRLLALYPEFAITINGEPYENDGFYASFERMLKIDRSSRRQETAWAESQGHPPPSRNRPEDFLWGPGIDIKGRWIGSQLRERCPEGHRINVNREDLRQTIERANPGQTLFLESIPDTIARQESQWPNGSPRQTRVATRHA